MYFRIESTLIIFMFGIVSSMSFASGARAPHKLAFDNFSDSCSTGYCMGMARTEQAAINASSKNNIFNKKGSKQPDHELEKTVRAALNGDKNARISGYSNLHELSKAHPEMLKKIVKDYQIDAINDSKQRASGKQEVNYLNDQVIPNIKKGRPTILGIRKGSTYHAILGLDYKNGKIKVQDPNIKGSRWIKLQKNKDGSYGSAAYYAPWAGGVVFDSKSIEHAGTDLPKKPNYYSEMKPFTSSNDPTSSYATQYRRTYRHR